MRFSQLVGNAGDLFCFGVDMQQMAAASENDAGLIQDSIVETDIFVFGPAGKMHLVPGLQFNRIGGGKGVQIGQ